VARCTGGSKAQTRLDRALTRAGFAAERILQRGEVAIDHGFDRGFEFEDRAMLQDGFDVGRKRGPVKEVVVAGDRKLGIVERERGVADLGVGNELRTPFDLLVEEVGVLAMKQIDGRGVGGTMTGEQAFRLLLICGQR
jgi:hypothetical protein